MERLDLVSVITPVYNRSATLEQCMESVMNQSYTNWEMLLVDDCSTDNSLEIIMAYAKRDPRIKAIELDKNGGAAIARNKAIEAAKGRFIAFLDSDDLWHPDKLARQVSFSKQHEAALTHTAYEWMDGAGKLTGKVIKAPNRLTYHKMLTSNYIGCLTAMYDTSVIGEKVYMPEVAKRQDYALWLKILRPGRTAYFLNETLASYRMGHDSLSSNKMDTILYYYRILRDIEGLGRIKAGYYFFIYLLKAFRKFYL